MTVFAIQTTSSGRMRPNTLMTRSMSRRMGNSTSTRRESWNALFTIPHMVLVGEFTGEFTIGNWLKHYFGNEDLS